METEATIIARLHLEAGQRQAALAKAIESMGKNDPPPGDGAITARAERFYEFLSLL